MTPEQLKIGKKVRINKNIELTTKILSSNHLMEEMAGGGNTYKITGTKRYRDHTVAIVNEYLWMPEDLIDLEGGIKGSINMKGEKVLFDPGEL